MIIAGTSGIIRLIALICSLVSTIGTLCASAAPVARIPQMPFDDTPIDTESRLVRMMDWLGLWIMVTAILIAGVYGPLFWVLFHRYVPVAGDRVWLTGPGNAP